MVSAAKLFSMCAGYALLALFTMRSGTGLADMLFCIVAVELLLPSSLCCMADCTRAVR